MSESKSSDAAKDQRKIKSVALMKEIMTEYYIGAKNAAYNDKKVCWITSGGPGEALIAKDVKPG